GSTELDLVVSRSLHVAADGKYLRAAVIGSTQCQECIAAVHHDPRCSGESLRVVDRRGLAVQAVARRKRGLEPRLPSFSFQRLEHCGLLAADICTPAVMRVELEREVRSENVAPKVARRVGLAESLLETLVDIPDFGVDIVVTHANAH